MFFFFFFSPQKISLLFYLTCIEDKFIHDTCSKQFKKKKSIQKDTIVIGVENLQYGIKIELNFNTRKTWETLAKE